MADLSKLRKLGRFSPKGPPPTGGPRPEAMMYRLVKLGALSEGKAPLCITAHHFVMLFADWQHGSVQL